MSNDCGYFLCNAVNMYVDLDGSSTTLAPLTSFPNLNWPPGSGSTPTSNTSRTRTAHMSQVTSMWGQLCGGPATLAITYQGDGDENQGLYTGSTYGAYNGPGAYHVTATNNYGESDEGSTVVTIAPDAFCMVNATIDTIIFAGPSQERIFPGETFTFWRPGPNSPWSSSRETEWSPNKLVPAYLYNFNTSQDATCPSSTDIIKYQTVGNGYDVTDLYTSTTDFAVKAFAVAQGQTSGQTIITTELVPWPYILNPSVLPVPYGPRAFQATADLWMTWYYLLYPSCTSPIPSCINAYQSPYHAPQGSFQWSWLPPIVVIGPVNQPSSGPQGPSALEFQEAFSKVPASDIPSSAPSLPPLPTGAFLTSGTLQVPASKVALCVVNDHSIAILVAFLNKSTGALEGPAVPLDPGQYWSSIIPTGWAVQVSSSATPSTVTTYPVSSYLMGPSPATIGSVPISMAPSTWYEPYYFAPTPFCVPEFVLPDNVDAVVTSPTPPPPTIVTAITSPCPQNINISVRPCPALRILARWRTANPTNHVDSNPPDAFAYFGSSALVSGQRLSITPNGGSVVMRPPRWDDVLVVEMPTADTCRNPNPADPVIGYAIAAVSLKTIWESRPAPSARTGPGMFYWFKEAIPLRSGTGDGAGLSNIWIAGDDGATVTLLLGDSNPTLQSQLGGGSPVLPLSATCAGTSQFVKGVCGVPGFTQCATIYDGLGLPIPYGCVGQFANVSTVNVWPGLGGGSIGSMCSAACGGDTSADPEVSAACGDVAAGRCGFTAESGSAGRDDGNTRPECGCVNYATSLVPAPVIAGRPMTWPQFVDWFSAEFGPAQGASPDSVALLLRDLQCWWPACQPTKQGAPFAQRPVCPPTVLECMALVENVVATNDSRLNIKLGNVCGVSRVGAANSSYKTQEKWTTIIGTPSTQTNTIYVMIIIGFIVVALCLFLFPLAWRRTSRPTNP